MAMNRTTLIKTASSLVLAGLCAMVYAGPLASSPQPSPQQPSRDADEIFQARCSTCHAEHGEGSEVGASLNVPDLRSARVQKNDDAFLRQFIKNGKNNMPAFGRDFPDQQIDSFIRLVRSFAAPSNQQAQTQSSTR
jgi:mono/diheme cytochrome c family protein